MGGVRGGVREGRSGLTDTVELPFLVDELRQGDKDLLKGSKMK